MPAAEQYCPRGRASVCLRSEAGPRPHVRRQLALGDRPAAGAPLRLGHVLGNRRRRGRPDVGDLMAALRRHRCGGQACAALAAGGRRVPEPLTGHRPGASSYLAGPAAFPAAVYPAPAATGPGPSSYTDCPTTGAATTWKNPAAPALKLFHPDRQAPHLRGQIPITRYASASRTASSACGNAASSPAEGTSGASDTAGNHFHPSPSANNPAPCRHNESSTPCRTALTGRPQFVS